MACRAPVPSLCFPGCVYLLIGIWGGPLSDPSCSSLRDPYLPLPCLMYLPPLMSVHSLNYKMLSPGPSTTQLKASSTRWRASWQRCCYPTWPSGSHFLLAPYLNQERAVKLTGAELSEHLRIWRKIPQKLRSGLGITQSHSSISSFWFAENIEKTNLHSTSLCSFPLPRQQRCEKKKNTGEDRNLSFLNSKNVI